MDELKKKIIEFLMDGNEVCEVCDGYGGNERVYKRDEVESMINDCSNLAELEDVVLNDFELKYVMGFGEVLDCVNG